MLKKLFCFFETRSKFLVNFKMSSPEEKKIEDLPSPAHIFKGLTLDSAISCSEIKKEGKTKMITKYWLKSESEKLQEVFYNPVQVFNRDLSLCVAWQVGLDLQKERKDFKGLRILDAMTASGLRALRMKIELPASLVSHVEGCDLSESAIALFKENIKLNGLDPNSIQSRNSFCCLFLLNGSFGPI